MSWIVMEDVWEEMKKIIRYQETIESRISLLESQIESLRLYQEDHYIHPQHEGRTIQVPL
mgnify:CR=1 FL=1